VNPPSRRSGASGNVCPVDDFAEPSPLAGRTFFPALDRGRAVCIPTSQRRSAGPRLGAGFRARRVKREVDAPSRLLANSPLSHSSPPHHAWEEQARARPDSPPAGSAPRSSLRLAAVARSMNSGQVPRRPCPDGAYSGSLSWSSGGVHASVPWRHREGLALARRFLNGPPRAPDTEGRGAAEPGAARPGFSRPHPVVTA
jgi:hypothetical protein